MAMLSGIIDARFTLARPSTGVSGRYALMMSSCSSGNRSPESTALFCVVRMLVSIASRFSIATNADVERCPSRVTMGESMIEVERERVLWVCPPRLSYAVVAPQ